MLLREDFRNIYFPTVVGKLTNDRELVMKHLRYRGELENIFFHVSVVLRELRQLSGDVGWCSVKRPLNWRSTALCKCSSSMMSTQES